jgi:cytidylate kinase
MRTRKAARVCGSDSCHLSIVGEAFDGPRVRYRGWVMPVITISSSFGAGGSVVAAQVAASIGWTMVNRAIPAAVADQLSVSLDVAIANDEEVESRFSRALARAAMQFSGEGGSHLPREIFAGDHAFMKVTETIVRQAADRSNCVIVGRAAAIILGDRVDVLNVRMDGPLKDRIRQGMEALHLTEEAARQKLQKTDRAREAYVRLFYKRNWSEPELYHLIVDSTAIPLDVCARIVIEAARGRGLIAAL